MLSPRWMLGSQPEVPLVRERLTRHGVAQYTSEGDRHHDRGTQTHKQPLYLHLIHIRMYISPVLLTYPPVASRLIPEFVLCPFGSHQDIIAACTAVMVAPDRSAFVGHVMLRYPGGSQTSMCVRDGRIESICICRIWLSHFPFLSAPIISACLSTLGCRT